MNKLTMCLCVLFAGTLALAQNQNNQNGGGGGGSLPAPPGSNYSPFSLSNTTISWAPYTTCDPTLGSFLTWDSTGANPANPNSPLPGWYCSGNGPYMLLAPSSLQQNFLSPAGTTIPAFVVTMPVSSTANLFTFNCASVSNCFYVDASANVHANSFIATGQSSVGCTSLPVSTPPSGFLYFGCDVATLRWYTEDATGKVAELSPGNSKLRCETGLGDGLNAITAGTYLQTICYNDSGSTWTITGIKCFTDNNGTSSLNASGNTLGALLTGAITCTNAFASGTQSANVALTSGDYINFTFIADGVSKQTTWVVSFTQ